jgi:hypothetical protein
VGAEGESWLRRGGQRSETQFQVVADLGVVLVHGHDLLPRIDAPGEEMDLLKFDPFLGGVEVVRQRFTSR